MLASAEEEEISRSSYADLEILGTWLVSTTRSIIFPSSRRFSTVGHQRNLLSIRSAARALSIIPTSCDIQDQGPTHRRRYLEHSRSVVAFG